MNRGAFAVRNALRSACLGVFIALTLGACSIETGRSAAGRGDLEPRTDAVVVGAFNFSESQILAEIYSHALEAAGIPAEVLLHVGAREIMEPALEQGEIDVVVEYLGTALTFVDPASAEAATSTDDAYERLRAEAESRGLQVLDRAPGQNRNEFVVSRSTALDLGLRNISDMAPIAETMTFGGPPECAARPLCLPGLEETYGLRFSGFTALDSGGPLTVAALRGGEVDVGLLFTTNPVLEQEDLLVLEDDEGLQPPEHLVPIVRAAAGRRHEGLVETINSVTPWLTKAELRGLNAQVEIEGLAAETVAKQWLAEKGLL